MGEQDIHKSETGNNEVYDKMDDKLADEDWDSPEFQTPIIPSNSNNPQPKADDIHISWDEVIEEKGPYGKFGFRIFLQPVLIRLDFKLILERWD